MQSRRFLSTIWCFFLFTASVGSVQAQVALRQSLAGEQAAEARERALETQPYNMKAGPVRLLLDASLGISGNDNIEYSEHNREADLIFEPGVNLHANWPITRYNALNLSLGLGYAKYLDHPSFDRFVMSPLSELSFVAFIKDVRINLHERFYFSEDPAENGSLSGVGRFGGFYNTAGVQMDADLNKGILTLGYDHFNFISSTPESDYLTRASEYLIGRAAFTVHPAITLGPEATGAFNRYDENILHDNTSFSAGAFADIKLGTRVRFRPRAGYVSYSFDSKDEAGITQDVSTYYVNLQISHSPRPNFNHTLDAGREVRLGTLADFIRYWYARYSAQVRVQKNLWLTGGAYYENGHDLQASGEEFDRVGVNVGARWVFNDHLSTRLSYRVVIKDSNTEDRSYYSNLLQLDMIYRF